MEELDQQQVRHAIVESLPIEASNFGSIPERKDIYFPLSHTKALRLECNLVIGARGVGKTFWSTALQSDAIRGMLSTSVTELSRVEVRTGFGVRSELNNYPDGDLFESLLSMGLEAYQIWRAVISRWLADVVSEVIPTDSWESTVAWVRSQPEDFSRLLERSNAAFEQRGKMGMIVFDALDQTSGDWKSMDAIVRGLLRVVLSLKRFPSLHGKVFLREDQFVGRQITDFPDASKLLSTRAELTWSHPDLHGLMWQRLCNGSDGHGRLLREIYKQVVGSLPSQPSPEVWAIGDSVKRDGGTQRALFAAIAGEWMGRDRRRGIPYLWSVGHLADGRGRTSPRSFLAAIRAASEETMNRYADHPLALHFEGIKRGVQKASEIRVSELAEDYSWVTKLMDPLRGVTVPCQFETVEQRWVSAFGESPANMKFQRLPPEHWESGWDGVRQDLVGLGLFESMRDGRLNMPDLYRVGFGLGRRGGIRPVTLNGRG